MRTKFRIAQLSDLHFSNGTQLLRDTHSHSIPHLRGLQEALRNQVLDRVIFSGDLSNYGDSESLLRARDWIFSSFSIGGGQTTGLRLQHDLVRIIPGNHDAWNRAAVSQRYIRWQRSLANYNDAFPEYAMDPTRKAAYYDWIQGDSCAIYLAFVDSSFLGDPVMEGELSESPIFDRIAKGKLSVRQSELLLSWHDAGLSGRLPHPIEKDKFLDKTLFAKSLKVLVMHHYIFEPTGHSDDYFMRITDRRLAFRNIALADFDVLLCGHKHVHDVHGYNYGREFDRRARMRYLLNCFRREVGISSLPIQYKDEAGRDLPVWLSTLMNIFVAMRRHSGDASEDYLADVSDLLHRALEDPSDIERQVTTFLRRHNRRAKDLLDANEMTELKLQIALNLGSEHREKLKPIIKVVKRFVASLDSRPFVQALCGSSAKSPAHHNAPRSYNLYQISYLEGIWKWECNRFYWIEADKRFTDIPETHSHEFRSSRSINSQRD
jgi:3',5'-cyclic AMP phosphodiesterase CpdA